MPQQNPLTDFHINAQSIRTVGRHLQRPECILAEQDGTLWSADGRGGVMRIAPDGKQTLVAQKFDSGSDTKAMPGADLFSGTLPNGLAFAPNGDLFVSNFGTDRLERMTRSGETTVLLDNLDGKPLGKVNFVLRDSKDRIWVTISTMVNPWNDAIRTGLSDGYIVIFDGRGARVVADGLRFTNELRFDAKEEWLYVSETTGKCVTRFRVGSDGSLGQREIFGPSSLGPGLSDGLAFDAYGNLWVTMMFADRLLAITPEGDLLELLDDGDKAATAKFEMDFASGKPVPMETLLACGGKIAPWLASITFGGPDLSLVYLGSLKGNTIPVFQSPVPGLALAHWGHALERAA